MPSTAHYGRFIPFLYNNFVTIKFQKKCLLEVVIVLREHVFPLGENLVNLQREEEQQAKNLKFSDSLPQQLLLLGLPLTFLSLR